ncbi:MAG: FecR domain-containing protein, partial [Nanoarchaeota archaeon]|nr:FecR domain-containing protein [Nanoarchaeota archaeon]
KVLIGIIWVEVNKFMGKDDDFEITTPNGVIGARGTKFQVSVKENQDEVVVYEGSVSMKSNYDGTEKIVNAGEKGILYKDKPSEIISFEDNVPLEIVMKDLCTNQIISTVQYTDNITKSLFGKDLPEGTDMHYLECKLIETRPKFVFFANKFIDPSTVNEKTLIISDEYNNNVPGYLDISNTIEFIPDKPIYGKIKVLLKKGGICSTSNVCLKEDISYEIQGANSQEKINFRLTPSDPIHVVKEVIFKNKGNSKIDATISIPSLTNYYPNVYYQFNGITPNTEYTLEGNENKFIDLEINLAPNEIKTYKLEYDGISFGREYFQYIDVSNINENQDMITKFTSPETGIESDNPKIIELSNKIVGDETNPFWKSYKIYNWITSTIKYNFDEIHSGGALATLEKEKGVCQDFAELFIALTRAQKIPTRYVGLYKPDDFEKGHAIAEIYIGGIGWIPVDPTWGTNFDNFARQGPILVQTFKQEYSSQKDKLYQLEGTNTNDLDVSISTSAYFINTTDQNWASVLEDPNLNDLNDLILISNINLRIDSFINSYNQLSNKELFKESFNQAEKDPFKITNDYVELKNNNINELNESTIEQLGIAITTYSEILDYLLNSLIDPNARKYTLTFENTTITQNNIPASLFEAKEKMDEAKSLFDSNDYSNAYNKFLDSYLPSHEGVEINIASILGLNSIDKSKLVTGKTISFVIITFIIYFACIIFWLWMLISSIARKEFRHLNKAGWILIVFFFSIVGALIYFFSEYIKKHK